MNDLNAPARLGDREALLHALYEAAELEHNLMCTYLYAAFSLKHGEEEGLSRAESEATARWRSALLGVAVEEMGHLAAVWNITSALGGSPRVGRANFPIDPGYLPASVVVKLAPFDADTLQHFIFLERPAGSDERDSAKFVAERQYVRGTDAPRLVPMGLNYDAIGSFYSTLSAGLRGLAARNGEDVVFSGDPALQLTANEIDLNGCRRVICLKTALAAFDSIVTQGEGALRDLTGSHFHRFLEVREELTALQRKNPAFVPAHPVATNPVLRRPPRPEGRVWIENPQAASVVDLANASYILMLRLLAHAYVLRGPSEEKSLVVGLAIGLMQAVAPLAEHAARLPSGPSNPDSHAGISFTTLRDAAPFPPSRGARHFFVERFAQLDAAATRIESEYGGARLQQAAQRLSQLAKRAQQGFSLAASETVGAATPPPRPEAAAPQPPASVQADGVETVSGRAIEVSFEAKRCIHSRFCVTGAPKVFLANVQGPWIHPDAMEVERLVEVAHACPSGAIRYRRLDGAPDERPPPVNLLGIREAGPYAARGQLQIDGEARGFRATLCRCGASKNKPFCDGSHHEVGFTATGEPPSGKTDMLPVRDGVLAIEPEINGPLSIRGPLEIVSGTGRVVARVTTARLCRCGGSSTKPFCDGTHARIGFRSDR